MNTINIIGRLVQEPELRHTTAGTAVCSFTLAVKRPRSKDDTDFLDCVAWEQAAEYLCRYGSKGAQVAVSGVLTTRKWEDKNGNKRTAFEIVVNDLNVLSSRSESLLSGEQKRQIGAIPSGSEAFEDAGGMDDGDLPF